MKISVDEQHEGVGTVKVVYNILPHNEPYIPFHYPFGNRKGLQRYRRLVAIKDNTTNTIHLYLKPEPRDNTLEQTRAYENKKHRERRAQEKRVSNVYITIKTEEDKKE